MTRLTLPTEQQDLRGVPELVRWLCLDAEYAHRKGFAIFTVRFLSKHKPTEGSHLLWRKHQPSGWDMKTNQTFQCSHSLHSCCRFIWAGSMFAGYSLLHTHIFPPALQHVSGETDSVSPTNWLTHLAWTVATRLNHTGIFLSSCPHTSSKKLAHSKLWTAT